MVVYGAIIGQWLLPGATIAIRWRPVLREEIDLSAVPPCFRRLLSACLERAARLLLEQPVAIPTPPAKSSRAPWIAAALAMAAAVILGIALWRNARPENRPLNRFRAGLGADATDSRT